LPDQYREAMRGATVVFIAVWRMLASAAVRNAIAYTPASLAPRKRPTSRTSTRWKTRFSELTSSRGMDTWNHERGS
jgi:hypothetical protein